MALPSHVVRSVVLLIIMLCNQTERDLQFEEQTRQSWLRVQQLQRQALLCQFVAILLLTHVSLQEAANLPSRLNSYNTDRLACSCDVL